MPPIPVSLKFTVPALLLGFAATLGAVNLLHHVPHAQRQADASSRKHFVQEISRLQSTLDYLLLKGDRAGAQHEVSVLAHNHDYLLAALTDDTRHVIASTSRAMIGRPITDALDEFDASNANDAVKGRRASIVPDPHGNRLLGYAAILMTPGPGEVRSSRAGVLFLSMDLARSRAEARDQVVNQSLYWAGWVAALALALWLVFHFLLTRRTARLVDAARQVTAGNFDARSGLSGRDELGQLGVAFDAMADAIAETRARLEADLNQRAQVQLALENSEAQYRSMFNASIDGLVLWNADARVVDVNPAMWKIFGYSEAEFMSLPPSRFVGPVRPADFLRTVTADAPQDTEITELRKDGSPVVLEVHAVPMSYRGARHVLTIARDVTEKRRAARTLAQQQESLHQREKLAALGALLAGVAHELNNPLSVVVARSVLLEENGEPTTRHAATKIRTAAERCARIVRTFLSMARQHPPERVSVAINDVVDSALEITAYAVRTSGIEIKLALSDAVPDVAADPDQLHQVILNLIVNAQQAMQDWQGLRSISIRSGHDGDQVWIEVEDSGPGIPAPISSQIFEPYFTTKSTGMGVGLAVSQGIALAHGGLLSFESPADGGARFRLSLPCSPTEPSQAQSMPHETDRSRHLDVLVVDDEEGVRETVKEILEAVGHRVAFAASGAQAIDRLKRHTFDAILTDVRMPDIDGITLFRQISEQWPDQARRVVFMTGDTMTGSLRDCASDRGRPVIEKPFLPQELRAAILRMSESNST